VAASSVAEVGIHRIVAVADTMVAVAVAIADNQYAAAVVPVGTVVEIVT
jgi:hypothetical protein